jgi:hypothetical protein
MKSLLRASVAFVVGITLASTGAAADQPQAALDAISKLRAERVTAARTATNRVDFAALSAEILAKARARRGWICS